MGWSGSGAVGGGTAGPVVPVIALACLVLATAGAVLAWAPPDRVRALAIATAGGILGAGVAAVLVGIPAVTAVAGLAAAAAPHVAARGRTRRVAEERRSAWPDAIDSVRAGIRAGAPLGQAVADAAPRVPDSLTDPFTRAALALTGGRPTQVAVTELAVDPVGQRVTAILQVADEVGASDIGSVLDALGSFLRADNAQRREVAARHSWNMAAARLAVLAPWLTVAALAIQPDGRAAYASPTGTVLLSGVAVVTAAAYWTMTKVAGDRRGDA